MRYAIVEISGRQYLVQPEKSFKVDFLGDVSELNCDKVLALADKGLEVGSPYLKSNLKFKVLGSVRGKKIRVATYHAKANTRKVKGFRETKSTLILA